MQSMASEIIARANLTPTTIIDGFLASNVFFRFMFSPNLLFLLLMVEQQSCFSKNSQDYS